jgi:hypothetical protein
LRRTPFLDEGAAPKWARYSTTDLLQKQYAKHLFKKKKIIDLDGSSGDDDADSGLTRPQLYLLATSLDPPGQAAFTCHGFHAANKDGVRKTYSTLTHDLGMAVAASSAFPGMFTSVNYQPKKDRSCFKLIDGGVYDNLGVRKFWELIEEDKEPINEVIVSDASVRFKAADRRTYLELLTTPLRAADILFKRVYDFETEFAKQADKEIKKCNFVFVRLRDKLPKSDKLALIPDYQHELSSTRTDLDVFSDLEIAALVRHGYSVARSKLANGVATPIKNLWDPVPSTKNILVKQMIDRNPRRSDEIVTHLQRSAARKYRLFSPYDVASWITALIVIVVIGYFVDTQYKLADSFTLRSEADTLKTQANQIIDQKLLENRIAAERREYRNALLQRQVSSNDWHGFLSDGTVRTENELRSVPLETWTTSQATYALLKSGELDRKTIAFLADAIESRFKPTGERKSDWNAEVGGWWVRPTEQKLQADPALWTLAATALILSRDDLDLDKRNSLKARIPMITDYLTKNNFLDWYNDELVFRIFANETEPHLHSPYTTSLALLALLEMRKQKLAWGSENPEDPSRMIFCILNWFDRHYDTGDRQGWTSVDGDLEKFPPDEAVNLQILAVMLAAYSEMQSVVPDKLKQRVSSHLANLEVSNINDSSARVQRQTRDAKDRVKTEEARVSFLWKPWAIKLCRLYLQALDLDSSAAEKANALAILQRLAAEIAKDSASPDEAGAASGTWTFRSSEMLIAIS